MLHFDVYRTWVWVASKNLKDKFKLEILFEDKVIQPFFFIMHTNNRMWLWLSCIATMPTVLDLKKSHIICKEKKGKKAKTENYFEALF